MFGLSYGVGALRVTNMDITIMNIGVRGVSWAFVGVPTILVVASCSEYRIVWSGGLQSSIFRLDQSVFFFLLHETRWLCLLSSVPGRICKYKPFLAAGWHIMGLIVQW